MGSVLEECGKLSLFLPRFNHYGYCEIGIVVLIAIKKNAVVRSIGLIFDVAVNLVDVIFG